MAYAGGFGNQLGLSGVFHVQQQAQMEALTGAFRSNAAMGGLSGGLGGLVFSDPKPKTYKDELQAETDEWLEDIK